MQICQSFCCTQSNLHSGWPIDRGGHHFLLTHHRDEISSNCWQRTRKQSIDQLLRCSIRRPPQYSGDECG
ncbi:hypothetical protein MANES_11G040553v8 [Manihot esculenta]|uniref:Uncharacterized protein n=1 Tax=Manihot esculenta TaxID=3983 RepID=A0ACB7GXP9_MANES|nr:hypothetical protein MANES_11G040553v8 [Manihot esculenta]